MAQFSVGVNRFQAAGSLAQATKRIWLHRRCIGVQLRERALITDVVHATVIVTIEILKNIARVYANATHEEYSAAVREALATAIARSNQDRGSTATQAAPAPEPAPSN